MENIGHFWLIFSLSFVAALSGALSPGPVLVYTITHSIKDNKTGYLTGAVVICGHALLEFVIVLLLFFGLSFTFRNTLLIKLVSILGSGFLFYLGISLIKDVLTGKIDMDFLDNNSYITENGNNKESSGLNNPFFGGIIISMSNPFWWFWWASIGTAFMSQYQVSLSNPSSLAAFYTGHEAADFTWYVPVSAMAFIGKKWLNKRVYSIVLMLCGIFMALFGIYMAANVIGSF